MHKENKNNFNNLFYFVSAFDACYRQYHDACMCIPLLVNKVQWSWVLRQQHHTHVSWYTCECVVETDMEEKKLLNKVNIFVHKKYSCSFMSHGLF